MRRNYWSLLDMGLSESDAQQLWHKAPHVFQELPLDAPALRAKLQWCREMIGLSVRDVVLHHRGFLTEGLRGLEQRVRQCLLPCPSLVASCSRLQPLLS